MRYVYPLDHAHALHPDEVLRLVGGKAANLGVMRRELGLPVPPGFVISTDACRAALDGGWPASLDGEIRAAMAVVESELGRGFGALDDPLLVSVRSGAPVSMPGMMDTVLNVGLTAQTEPGLAAVAGATFTADCRRRLAATFRDSLGAGDPPDDPWAQLRLSIDAVFRSWNSDRARTYRAREGLPDDLGTAVTVQAMVFGNRDDRSATGVAFTRNPATGEPTLYGDVLFRAQGEDVVAGTHGTEPITALASRLPAVASQLEDCADRLERHFADMCDIEFTIESGVLWLLQVRVGKRSPQAALRLAIEMAEDLAFPLTREAAVRRVARILAAPPRSTVRRDPALEPLVVGLAASPGLATGGVATSPDAAVRLADAGRAVILVREETSPDDVHGMARAAGILTARGGIASHAAVVARGWGIPAVVNATSIEVTSEGLRVDGRGIAAGEIITIDGSTGEVFEGALEVASDEVVPAAAILLGWARELGIPIEPADGAPPPVRDAEAAADMQEAPGASAATFASAATVDDCLVLVALKGLVTAEAIADALGAPAPEAAAELATRLVDGGLATSAGGAYRLTDAGRQRHRTLIAGERRAIGAEAAEQLLDGLLALDAEMKQAVTAWQLRDVTPGAEPVPNDHADAEYDDAVLRRLRDVANAADRWLADAPAVVPRLRRYRARLRRAADAAIAGDGRFVASPRVDSFHGVWFELHEELILLAGRTREDETAAGRA
ncbi:MAG TPA: pyruvate, phosphate dikinase [Candidatus Limnocylindrales bacterium]|nr:pyruvate, phosphate dikinase [Candidatus Limnocylindrales bacterium]